MKKTEDIAAIRRLSDSELGERFSNLKRELYDARIRIQGLPASEIQRLRKSIARVQTVARERDLVIH